MIPYIAGGIVTFIIFIIIYIKYVKKTDLFFNKDKTLEEIQKDVDGLNKAVLTLVG